MKAEAAEAQVLSLGFQSNGLVEQRGPRDAAHTHHHPSDYESWDTGTLGRGDAGALARPPLPAQPNSPSR